MNIEALHQGYELMKDKLDTVNGDYLLEDSEGTPHLYMIGNDAIGLGAISAGSNLWQLIHYARFRNYGVYDCKCSKSRRNCSTN